MRKISTAHFRWKKVLPFLLFVCFCLFFLFARKGKLLLASLLVLALHEGAHFLVARKRGFVPTGFTLTPFGATMAFDSGLSDADEFAVALAGPLANLVLCPLLVTLWWFFPATYPYTLSLFRSSFALALFNLLPTYPFDGGRIAFSLSKDKVGRRKYKTIISCVSGAVLLVLGVLSFIFLKNILFLFAALTVVISAVSSSENERYTLIFSQMGIFSSRVPRERRDIYTEEDVAVKKVLSLLRSRKAFYIVHVMRDEKELDLLYGERLERLFFGDRNRKIGDVVAL